MEDKRLTIPNVISIIRILTIPVIVWLIVYFSEKYYAMLITIFFFSVVLDFFDGYLARKLCQESELGKILDPLADKVMIIGVAIALVVKAGFPIWLAVLLIGRDALILLASTLLMRKKQVIVPSILVGKITFGLLSALMMVYLVDLSQTVNLDILKHFFTVISLCFLTWSVVGYYAVYQREKKCLK